MLLLFVLSLLALGTEGCSSHGEIGFLLVSALGTYEYVFGKGTSHGSADEPCAHCISILHSLGSRSRSCLLFDRRLFFLDLFDNFLNRFLMRYGKMLGSGLDLDRFIYRPCPGLGVFEYALGDIKGTIVTILPAYAHPVNTPQ